MSETKYRVVDYGHYWGYVAERYERGLFGWKWKPVKVPDPHEWRSDGWMYIHGETPDRARKKLTDYIECMEIDRKLRHRQYAMIAERDNTRGTIAIDEFTLTEF